MKLFTWQNECLHIWLSNDTRGIINVITGAGKTVLALSACEALMEQYPESLNIRIIVPTIALLRQWKKEILSFFPDLSPEQIGVYHGEVKNSADRLFTIYVVNSARYSVSRHILQGMDHHMHQFLICDECHRYTGPNNRLIFAFRNYPEFQRDLYHSLGMSATPQNALYEQVLVPALGKEIYRYNTEQARSEDRIAGLAVMHVSVPFTGTEHRQYEILDLQIRKTYALLLSEYPELKCMNTDTLLRFLSSLETEDPESLPALYCNLIRKRRSIIILASNRIQCTMDLLRITKPEERVIVFCERISQAEQLYQKILTELTPHAGHYHSDLTSQMKQYYLDQFRTGAHRILVTCRALDEGLNVPDAAIGIVLSSSQNQRQRIQRLGRILRKGKNKKATMYYLHTSAAADRFYYLNDLPEDTDIADMEYLPEENDFYCDEYAIRAQKLLRDKSFSPKEYEEFGRCIDEGNGRADWLLSSELYHMNLAQAKTQKESNYWTVMKKLYETAPGK